MYSLKVFKDGNSLQCRPYNGAACIYTHKHTHSLCTGFLVSGMPVFDVIQPLCAAYTLSLPTHTQTRIWQVGIYTMAFLFLFSFYLGWNISLKKNESSLFVYPVNFLSDIISVTPWLLTSKRLNYILTAGSGAVIKASGWHNRILGGIGKVLCHIFSTLSSDFTPLQLWETTRVVH